MFFYSDKFYYNNIYSQDVGLSLVSEGSDILNEYGISYVGDKENSEITLTFCYVDNLDQPLPWTAEVLENVLGWLIANEYLEFISEDDSEITYFLKGINYNKRFTHDRKGLLDVTFSVLDSCGYRNYINKVKNPTSPFIILNKSNFNKTCKPIIELSNISSQTIKITNLTTKKPSFILNINSSEKITIDNETGMILNDKNENLIMDSNRKWIELVKGENSISVEGKCDIAFKFYCPVMV